MGFFADFMPFYPKDKTRGDVRRFSQADIDRALDVELHGNPDLQTRRADTGELVLRLKRQLHPAERFLGRLFGVKHYRQIVLDKIGEFLLEEATKPNVKLAHVAPKMAETFGLELQDAKLGIVHVVRELMVRDFVFLVRRETGDHGARTRECQSED